MKLADVGNLPRADLVEHARQAERGHSQAKRIPQDSDRRLIRQTIPIRPPTAHRSLEPKPISLGCSEEGKVAMTRQYMYLFLLDSFIPYDRHLTKHGVAQSSPAMKPTTCLRLRICDMESSDIHVRRLHGRLSKILYALVPRPALIIRL